MKKIGILQWIVPTQMLLLLAAGPAVWSYQPAVLPNRAKRATHIPHVIQGGMGIRISKWSLAREVSLMGELGVVSGTAIDTILVRELQDGDKDGSIRRALSTFPDQDMANRIIDTYYVEGGKDATKPYKSIPMWTIKPQQHLLEVCVLANYCEVWLAKHNDDGTPTNGLVGLNLLTKVQLPTLPSLYGAILADVDYVIMGAGTRKKPKKTKIR
jgi:NAD(P)H-dependent flavin oxidoreductase YrpB (nitropropane dioxygenase family)